MKGPTLCWGGLKDRHIPLRKIQYDTRGSMMITKQSTLSLKRGVSPCNAPMEEMTRDGGNLDITGRQSSEFSI